MLLSPSSSSDPIEHMQKSFLHVAYSYVDLRQAIRWENGPQIVVNLTAVFPKHIADIAIHNRTVNIQGKPGQSKPVDQFIEHYNL